MPRYPPQNIDRYLLPGCGSRGPLFKLGRRYHRSGMLRALSGPVVSLTGAASRAVGAQDRLSIQMRRSTVKAMSRSLQKSCTVHSTSG